MKNRLKKVLLAVLFSILLLSYGAVFRYSTNFSTPQNAKDHMQNAKNHLIIEPNVGGKHNDHHSSAHYYCNYPHEFNTSNFKEGSGFPGWKLKQVHVVIRHGDRTAIKHYLHPPSDVEPSFCNIFKDPIVAQYDIFQKFRNFVSSQQGAPAFLAPVQRQCTSAQLTTLGVLQHLQNGMFLQERYLKELEITDENAFTKTKFQSTSYSRTMLSAVAFAFGFLPKYQSRRIYVKRVKNIMFCSENCYCPSDKYYDKLINARKKKLQLERHQHMKTIQTIASVSSLPVRIGPQMDALVTGSHCKSLKLPCNPSGSCITEDNLDVIMDEQENLIKTLLADTPLLKQSLLRVQPLLKSISISMKSAIDDSKNSLKFALYSGHDGTVRPLLYAFGIPDNRWPRLASRFVFELWEFKQQHYIRMLYNGKDVTAMTSFCSGLSECRLDDFSRFITDGIPAHFKAKSRQEACGAFD